MDALVINGTRLGRYRRLADIVTHSQPINETKLDRYGVVGDPIAHSKSPLLHRTFAAATHQAMSYEKFHVTADQFALFVQQFFAQGGRGLNVTVPHKVSAAALAKTLTPRARQAGAVNTLLLNQHGDLVGDNTDGAGLIADLDRLGVSLTNSRIVILGAGGAVRGILGPLLARNPAVVCIANRNITRANELIKDFVVDASSTQLLARTWDELNKLGSVDLLLQATPLGLQGERPNIPKSLVTTHTLAYDLGYGDGPTPFESWAIASGAHQAVSGIGMLIEQAAEAFTVWRGLRPDTSSLHRDLAS
jgi:shikimate dehydrogenase